VPVSASGGIVNYHDTGSVEMAIDAIRKQLNQILASKCDVVDLMMVFMPSP